MLGKNIKALRLSKGLSQQALAEQLHVVRQTVSKWESGLSVPDADLLIRLSQLLGVTPGELLGQELEPSAESAEQLAKRLAELGELLATRTRRLRRTMRALAALLLVASLLLLLWAAPSLLAPLSGAPSLPEGAIGGADGPTDILVWSRPTAAGTAAAIIGAIAAAAGAVLLLVKSRRS